MVPIHCTHAVIKCKTQYIILIKYTLYIDLEAHTALVTYRFALPHQPQLYHSPVHMYMHRYNVACWTVRICTSGRGDERCMGEYTKTSHDNNNWSGLVHQPKPKKLQQTREREKERERN